jgi:hypothetical protein
VLDFEAMRPEIDNAIEGLPSNNMNRDILINQIENVILCAHIRGIPPSERIGSAAIVGAIEEIEKGLTQIAEGLNKIDAARRTLGPNSERRADSLEIVHRAALGAIANAVLRGCKVTNFTAEQLADAMPKYGGNSFANSWNGLFGNASQQFRSVAQTYRVADFKIPTKEQEEWFIRAIAELAAIYRNATGKKAAAYNRSEGAKRDWTPPFIAFVHSLWPLLRLESEPFPSAGKIANALKAAPLLPQSGEVK